MLERVPPLSSAHVTPPNKLDDISIDMSTRRMLSQILAKIGTLLTDVERFNHAEVEQLRKTYLTQSKEIAGQMRSKGNWSLAIAAIALGGGVGSIFIRLPRIKEIVQVASQNIPSLRPFIEARFDAGVKTLDAQAQLTFYDLQEKEKSQQANEQLRKPISDTLQAELSSVRNAAHMN